jgi:hypothetical protein
MNKTKYFILQTILLDYKEFHKLYKESLKRNSATGAEKLRGDLARISNTLEIRTKLFNEILEDRIPEKIGHLLLECEKNLI